MEFCQAGKVGTLILADLPTKDFVLRVMSGERNRTENEDSDPDVSSTPLVPFQGHAFVMAYFHQRRWIWTRLPVRGVSLIATLYHAEIFPLVQIRIQIPVWRFSLMATVPILGRISVPGIRIRICLCWWK